MDKEAIRTEFERRAKQLLTTQYPSVNGRSIDNLINHLDLRSKQAKKFSEDVSTLLNQIIKEQGLDLDQEAINELLMYLKPTTTKVFANFISRRS
jgi:uncharacterized tellurite resistance protein B-like protein